MLKLSLCDYSDVCIFVSGTITISNSGTVSAPNNRKNIIIKNCAPFTDCITEMSNTQIHNSEDIDEVMPMYDLIEHIIVTRNNIVWKLARGYCLCYCKTFSLVPDPTESIKKLFYRRVQYINCTT